MGFGRCGDDDVAEVVIDRDGVGALEKVLVEGEDDLPLPEQLRGGILLAVVAAAGRVDFGDAGNAQFVGAISQEQVY